MHTKVSLISVLIPCYNHQQYIQECIESIWAQNMQEVEIIAIDDGSTDSTFTVLEKLQVKSPIPMHISTRENKGVTKTLNEALHKAKGRYITIIASDDKYYPNIFSSLIQNFQQDPSLKLLYANGRGFDGQNIHSKVHHDAIVTLLQKSPCQIHRWLLENVPTPLLTQCALFDKEMLLEIGGWDEDLRLDDWPLNIKIFDFLCQKGYQHLFIDTDMTLYRAHETQANRDSLKMYSIIAETILKYTPKNRQSIFLTKQAISYAKNLYKKDCKQAQHLLHKTMQQNNIKRLHKLKILRVLLKYNYKYRKVCTK